jgi:hypothetical protein
LRDKRLEGELEEVKEEERGSADVTILAAFVEEIKEEEDNDGEDNSLSFISLSLAAMKPRPRSNKRGSSCAFDDVAEASAVFIAESPWLILLSTILPRD